MHAHTRQRHTKKSKHSEWTQWDEAKTGRWHRTEMSGENPSWYVRHAECRLLAKGEKMKKRPVKTGINLQHKISYSTSSDLDSSLGVSVSADEVVSNSSLFSRMKLRCMRAICAMIRSRRLAASSTFLRFSLSSLLSMPPLPPPRWARLAGVVTAPSASEFCRPPISSSDFYTTQVHTETNINLTHKYVAQLARFSRVTSCPGKLTSGIVVAVLVQAESLPVTQTIALKHWRMASKITHLKRVLYAILCPTLNHENSNAHINLISIELTMVARKPARLSQHKQDKAIWTPAITHCPQIYTITATK